MSTNAAATKSKPVTDAAKSGVPPKAGPPPAVVQQKPVVKAAKAVVPPVAAKPSAGAAGGSTAGAGAGAAGAGAASAAGGGSKKRSAGAAASVSKSKSSGKARPRSDSAIENSSDVEDSDGEGGVIKRPRRSLYKGAALMEDGSYRHTWVESPKDFRTGQWTAREDNMVRARSCWTFMCAFDNAFVFICECECEYHVMSSRVMLERRSGRLA